MLWRASARLPRLASSFIVRSHRPFSSVSATAVPINGTAIAEGVLKGVREDVASLQAKHGVTPGLAVVVVGERRDSLKYVKKKHDLAESLGLRSMLIALATDVSADTVRHTIQQLNEDPNCDGILLQLPLPAHLSANEILLSIDPSKDVDGFHPMNAGRLCCWRTATLAPCTPRGVVHMLRVSGVPLAGAHVAIVGESNVVGLPLAHMLLAERATLTVVHKHTPNPAKLTSQADVLVSAAGVAGLITPKWVKPGAVVIDVGINFAPDPSCGNKLRMCGDVAPEVWAVASRVSPVPGGVGPMTVAMLMRNLVDACLMRFKWVELLEHRAGATAMATAPVSSETPVGSLLTAAVAGTAWVDKAGEGTVELGDLRSVMQRQGQGV